MPEAHNLVFPSMCCLLRAGGKELFFHVAPPAEHREGDRIVVAETREGVPTGREIHGVVTSVNQDAVKPEPEKAAACDFPALRGIYETGLAEVRFGQIEVCGFELGPPIDYAPMRAEYLAHAGQGVL